MGMQTKRWPHACSTAIKDIRRQAQGQYVAVLAVGILPEIIGHIVLCALPDSLISQLTRTNNPAVS